MGADMIEQLKRLVHEEEAPTTVEYAIMLAAITGVIVAVVFLFGGAVKSMFEDSTKKIQSGGN
jgi:Flp pilus assembly pilin Flp